MEETVKFKDIKVGDEVLIEKKLSYGWRSELSFWVKTKVTKVTNTQFEVDRYPNEKFRKSNGGIVKSESWLRCALEGDYDSFSRTVKDQTLEYLDAVHKFELIRKIRESYSAFEKQSVPSLVKEDRIKLERILNSLQGLLQKDTEEK